MRPLTLLDLLRTVLALAAGRARRLLARECPRCGCELGGWEHRGRCGPAWGED